jgi:NADH:ubiquinone oxidoreductase subunit 6 (subunit J)
MSLNNIIIVGTLIIALIYMVTILVLRKYIRSKIKIKAKRKEYIRRQNLKEVANDLFSPFLLLLGLLALLDENSFNLEGGFLILFIIRVIVFVGAIVIMVLQVINLRYIINDLNHQNFED